MGKKILLKDGQKVIKNFTITDKNMLIENIPVGSYTLEMPVLMGEYMFIKPQVTIISNGLNTEKNFKYEKVSNDNISKNTIKVQFQGYYYNDVAEINLIKNQQTNKKQLKLRYRGTTLQPTYDSVNAKIQVFNNEEQSVYEKTVLNGQMFSNTHVEELFIDVEPGYKLVLTNAYPEKLKFINLLTGEYLTELETKSKETTYIITENSIIKQNMTEEECYSIKRNVYKKYINDFVASVTETDLKDKSLDQDEKQIIIEAYNFFNLEDKQSIQDI